MSFAKEAIVTPIAIGDIATELFDPVPNGGQSQSATVSIQIVMSDGKVVVRKYNLVEHVPAETITQLIGLAAFIRGKAQEILPAQTAALGGR